ncbi:MAG: hypothetical protein ACK4N5_09930 [Myxococcales bacterium]
MTTTATDTTAAQQVAARLGDDGMSFRTADGQSLRELADAHGARVQHGTDSSERYVFPDGSVITAVGGGWDFGFSDCWCWQGAGHNCANE